jgi:hypothetical protein
VDTATTALRGLEGQEVNQLEQRTLQANAIMADALAAFGSARQVDKCIEELGELATALVKYRHGEATAEQVIDELADVAIVGGTMKILFDPTAVDARIAVKLSRLSRLVADQVAAKPEPKPEKPMLRWEAGKGDELVLLKRSVRLGSVCRSQYFADQWVAYADGKPTTTHAHKETAINIVCMELGLSVCEVPVWKP